VLTGIGVCLSLTLVALLLREPPRGRSEHEPQPGYLATLTGGVRIAWRDRAVRWLVLLNGLLAATLGATNYLIQPLLVSRGVEVGFLFSTLQLPWLVFAAVGAFIAGALVRRAGEVVVLGGVVVVGAAAYALLASTSTPASFALFGVVAAMEALLVPVVTGYVNRRTPSAQRATVLSTQSLVRGLCFAPLGPLVGTAADTRGIEWALGMLGTLLVAGAAVVWPLWLRAHRRAARERMAEALAAGARLRGGGLDEVEAAPE
jgi:MFS family permease